ncbi:glutathione S-transferase kappa 1 [Entomortierella parvispora]|uniref:Glutathione S-transferase kappa n=1 Tax=Entomortierella parvispora TaxID=205924 RepID=A0A9P3H905_9FUNG|nr:glutathione S-transferase kappa 1 [Entomortierella parvispora]
MASRASVVMYYDLVSPYSFMGFKLFNKIRHQWSGVDVSFKPMLLGGVMNAVKNEPLFKFPSKKNHMVADLDRISVVTGVPFNFPAEFPVLTVLPMRVLTALQIHEADKYEQCIDKLFDEYFVHGHNISKAEVIQAALTPIFSQDPSPLAKVQSYLQFASDPQIKQVFKENTEEAVAKGAYGAPTFLVKKVGSSEEMLFFGSDRLEMIAAMLGMPYPGLINIKNMAAGSQPKL